MYRQAGETDLNGFDICIVGAGAAGISIAKRLIGSSKKVLLIAGGQAQDRGCPEDRRQSIYKGTVGDFLKRFNPIF